MEPKKFPPGFLEYRKITFEVLDDPEYLDIVWHWLQTLRPPGANEEEFLESLRDAVAKALAEWN